MNRVAVIIVAAGEGQRFGAPKQFIPLADKAVLEWCLELFEKHIQVAKIILVLMSDVQKKEYKERYRKITHVVTGGEHRQDSVFAGFNQIDPSETDYVLIHDGVRPLVSHELVNRVINATKRSGAAIPVIPVEDTVKLIEGDKIMDTLDRTKIRRVQTPQGFSYQVLKTALSRARDEEYFGTDEATLVERMGGEVALVEGDPKNIKITTPDDLRIVEALIED
jgi:2-C-methyl-D-erythritol 4-phosphate cytidylyltransferase